MNQKFSDGQKQVSRVDSTLDALGLLDRMPGELVKLARLIRFSRKHQVQEVEDTARQLKGNLSGLGKSVLIKLLRDPRCGKGAAFALQGVSDEKSLEKIADLARHKHLGVAFLALTALEKSNSPIVDNLYRELLNDPSKAKLRAKIASAIDQKDVVDDRLLEVWTRSFSLLAAPHVDETSALVYTLVKRGDAKIVSGLIATCAGANKETQLALVKISLSWPDGNQRCEFMRNLIRAGVGSESFCEVAAKELFASNDPKNVLFALSQCTKPGDLPFDSAKIFSEAFFDRISSAAKYSTFRSQISEHLSGVPDNLRRFFESDVTTHATGSEHIPPLDTAALVNIWRKSVFSHGDLFYLAKDKVLPGKYVSKGETLQDLGITVLNPVPCCPGLHYCQLPAAWSVAQREGSRTTTIYDGYGICRMGLISSSDGRGELQLVSAELLNRGPNPGSFRQLPEGTFKARYLAELVSVGARTHIAILSKDGRLAEYGVITPGGADYLNLTLDFGGKKKLDQAALDSGNVHIRTLSVSELQKRPKENGDDDNLQLEHRLGLPYRPDTTRQKENSRIDLQQEEELKRRDEQMRAQQSQILLNWLNATLRQRQLNQDRYIGLDR